MTPGLTKTVMTVVAGLALGVAAIPTVPVPLKGALVWLAGMLKGGAWIAEPATANQRAARVAKALAKEER